MQQQPHRARAAGSGHSERLLTKSHLSVPCRAFLLTCRITASPLMPCAGAEMNGYERESPFSIAEVGNAAPASEQQAVEDCSQQQNGASHQNGSSSAEGGELQQGNGSTAAVNSPQGMHTPRVGETLDSMDASDLWLDAGVAEPLLFCFQHHVSTPKERGGSAVQASCTMSPSFLTNFGQSLLLIMHDAPQQTPYPPRQLSTAPPTCLQPRL